MAEALVRAHRPIRCRRLGTPRFDAPLGCADSAAFGGPSVPARRPARPESASAVRQHACGAAGAEPPKGRSSIGRVTGLQNRRLGVRVPPALRAAQYRTTTSTSDRSDATTDRWTRPGDDTTAREPRPRRAGDAKKRGKKPLLARASALFYRQVVAELRKVIWPTRKELITYTTVVIVFVVVVIDAASPALDFGFTKAVFAVFG